MSNNISKFENWVAERLSIQEKMLEIFIGYCENALYLKEAMRKEVFESYFKTEYMCINDDVDVAKSMSENENISTEVLEDALMKFKQMKSKACKVKAKYKRLLVS